MAEEFETHSRTKGEPTNRDLAITAFLKTYAVPYFTKNKITDISAKEVAKFFDWRRACCFYAIKWLDAELKLCYNLITAFSP